MAVPQTQGGLNSSLSSGIFTTPINAPVNPVVFPPNGSNISSAVKCPVDEVNTAVDDNEDSDIKNTFDQRQLSQFIKELVCPVCLTNYKELILECGHSLCPCCSEIISKSDASSNVSCPVCRKQTPRSAIKTDYTLKGAVAALRESGVVQVKQRQAPACVACSNEKAATWCSMCGYMCAKCSTQVHTVLKTHKPIPIEDSLEHDDKSDNTVLPVQLSKKEELELIVKLAQKKAEGIPSLLEAIAATKMQVTHTSDSFTRDMTLCEAKLHTLLTEKFASVIKAAAEITEKRNTEIEAATKMVEDYNMHLQTAIQIGSAICGENREIIVEDVEKVQKASCAAVLDIISVGNAISSLPPKAVPVATIGIETAINTLPLPCEERIAVAVSAFPELSRSTVPLQLDPTTVRGGTFIITSATSIKKTEHKHCSISCTSGFQLGSGKTRWTWRVRYLDASLSPTKGWLLIAVHRDPASASILSYKDVGCCGVSVTVPDCPHNRCYQSGRRLEEKGNITVEPGNVLDCILDLEAGTFSVSQANNWIETVRLDHKEATWYPHFNPSGASFALE